MADIQPLNTEETAGQLLIETDWAEEWKRVQRSRKHVDCPDRWNKRAPSFGGALFSSPYADQFIELLNLQPGDTVFDMGCGNGAIAIPLAKAGFHVVARDFSEGMLAGLAEAAAASGEEVAARIDAARMAWEDDWEAAGLTPAFADVAFASRSMITSDLGAAIAKLSWAAKRFACATISTGYTPMMSPTMLRDLGISRVPAYDFAYTFNILMQLGYSPEVRYIVHDRFISFDSLDEGEEQLLAQLEHAQTYCDAEELRVAATRLRAWMEERVQPNEFGGMLNRHGKPEGRLKIQMHDDIRWAFLKWDV